MVALPTALRVQIDAVYPAPLVPFPWEAPEVTNQIDMVMIRFSLTIQRLILILVMVIVPVDLCFWIDAVYPAPLVPLP